MEKQYIVKFFGGAMGPFPDPITAAQYLAAFGIGADVAAIEEIIQPAPRSVLNVIAYSLVRDKANANRDDLLRAMTASHVEADDAAIDAAFKAAQQLHTLIVGDDETMVRKAKTVIEAIKQLRQRYPNLSLAEARERAYTIRGGHF